MVAVTRQAKDLEMWSARLANRRDGSLQASATGRKHPELWLFPHHACQSSLWIKSCAQVLLHSTLGVGEQLGRQKQEIAQCHGLV